MADRIADVPGHLRHYAAIMQPRARELRRTAWRTTCIFDVTPPGFGVDDFAPNSEKFAGTVVLI